MISQADERSSLDLCPLAGLVIIGRNEGERLIECFRSVEGLAVPVVYVDSGSIDASRGVASQAGAVVVDLDLSTPFTAARARNAGFRVLLSQTPHLSFVQFMDGDCQLQQGWLTEACAFLHCHDDVAIVFGRRRERYPRRSIYNTICDEEWAGTPGEAKECGGDILVRVSAFKAVNGYRDELIAGEEPELCVRLRENGHRIWRLDSEMTLHDANILGFRQWWRRSVRAGHAYVEVYLEHRRSRHRIWGSNLLRSVFWTALLPAAVFTSVVFHPALIGIALLYPLQFLRLRQRDHDSRRAVLSLLGKFAEAQGVMRFAGKRLFRRQPSLIEYK